MGTKIVLLLLPLLVIADEYSFKTEIDSYSKYTESQIRSNENIFIKDGKEFISDNRVLVSFYEKIDIDSFKKKYSLVLIKKISEYRENYLFEVRNSFGKTCENIGKEKSVRYAIPNWKLEKILY